VPPADFSALATAIINLLQNQDQRATMSANSFSRIEEFSLANMCQKTVDVYFN
jgi:glycosyltransferase involved in cell wall biosynthesis